MKCKICSAENLEGTRYCQSCGEPLKESVSIGFPWKHGKAYAGLGHKGSSIAPLGAMAIERQGKELEPGNAHKNLVKVCPCQDGTWYCPDCGELNQQYKNFCKNCGRDYV
ncbi:hypothetical protein E5329_20835 [Petralouisia muris]|uniref:Uncharacterized protein n=1 Tax=Petralouisia muris TaxID=3032872 RepID=A0AC61RR47_9FIRM|nr:zinc ribbon domain-containing protein [Petralouisia muris]TGY91474.1 hypothetical protein E5329_20835 [Petralouisia muris]